MILLSFDFGALLQDVLSGLAVTGIASIVGLFFLERYLSQLMFTRKMENMGFLSQSTNRQTKKEIAWMCREATLIKILYVSGAHYMAENEKYFKQAMERGVKIQFLCAHPDSEFLLDIERLEVQTGKRKAGTSIGDEIRKVSSQYDDTNMQIRYFNTEYRLPYVIAYFGNGEVRTWLTVTLPPYKSGSSFVLRGSMTKDKQNNNKELNFIEMIELNFDTSWNFATTDINGSSKRVGFWSELQGIAMKEMDRRLSSGKGLLIEVAAQHPLDADGITPGPDFRMRLDEAIRIYNDPVLNGEGVKIYVPGSRHKAYGVADQIALAEAGRRYLLEHGVREEDIFAEESNTRYKLEGVYNSSDESYVACRLFDNGNFRKLYCICAPHQVTRKAMSCIRCGFIPHFITASTYGFSKCYVEEVFESIPSVVNDEYALQINNLIADRLRLDRNPDHKPIDENSKTVRLHWAEVAKWMNRKTEREIPDDLRHIADCEAR